MLGRVVKLDRGFPLVQTEDGELLRCKHATDLVKTAENRAVIGDYVDLTIPETNDKAFISQIRERKNAFVRKDPAERSVSQVLAANFELILIAQPLAELNLRRLERELVLAHETGARIVVLLTKSDAVADAEEVKKIQSEVCERVGNDILVIAISSLENSGMQEVEKLIAPGETAILIGRSGVGKSSLVNSLLNEEVQATAAVREGDGKGRHTTVSREIIALPNGGFICDMPGVRGLGMWETEDGIGAAFSDIEELAQSCRFGDCKHINEPGCAVLQALEQGELTKLRWESYQRLMQETRQTRERKEKARWAAKTTHAKQRAKNKQAYSKNSRVQ